MTLRLRVLLPAPHDLVQLVQSCHELTAQCTGHGTSWHGRTSAVSGHTYPPCAACVSMLRERLCMPMPQLFVHVDQLVQLDTSQWIGQRPSEHACSCVSAPQPLPPCWVRVSTPRLRLCVPAPHVVVQVLQSLQRSTTQSTGHGATAHG